MGVFTIDCHVCVCRIVPLCRTINGLIIGERRCEPLITAVGYSSCPEGVSVNVVVTGHKNGMVRLWSSWDLSPVRDIPSLQTSAVTAVAYSFDNQVGSLEVVSHHLSSNIHPHL